MRLHPSQSRRALLALWAASILAGGCEDTRLAPMALRVEFSGCAQLIAGPRCELEVGVPLRLWVRGEAAALTLLLDGKPRTVQPEARLGGRSIVVDAAGASMLELRVGQAERLSAWRLWLDPPDGDAAFSTARAAFAQGDLDAADAALRGLLSAETGPRAVRAASQVARIELQRGRLGRSVALLQESMGAAGDLGLLRQAADDAALMAWIYSSELREPMLARKALHQNATLAFQYAGSRLRGDLAAAWLELHAGSPLRAGRHLEAAHTRVRKLQLEAQVPELSQLRAHRLAMLGHYGAAAELLEAGAAQTQGRSPFLAMPPPLDARELRLRVAPRLERLSLLGALAAAGDAQNARARAFAHELEGEKALSGGDARQALRAFGQLHEVADQIPWPAARLRAVLGTARAHRALGRSADAAENLAFARRLVAGMRLGLVAGYELPPARAELETLAQMELELLVDAGKPPEAWRSARSLRGLRALPTLRARRIATFDAALAERFEAVTARCLGLRRELEQVTRKLGNYADASPAERERRRAQLLNGGRECGAEATELLAGGRLERALAPARYPPKGFSLLLASTARDWLAFLATGDAPRDLRRLRGAAGKTSVGTMAELLSPLAATIATTPMLRVLDHPAMDTVALGAIPLGAAPLLEQVPLIYSVGLPRAFAPDAGATQAVKLGRRALIAVGEGGADEAAAVGAKLREAGFELHLLEAPVLRARELAAALAGCDLFIWAGPLVAAGADYDAPALALPGGELFSSTRVLSLPRVPQLVVLARGAPQAAAVDVARSFVVAGARGAVTSIEGVSPSVARALTLGLLAEGIVNAEDDAARAGALRRSQLNLRRADASAPWASWRLIAP